MTNIQTRTPITGATDNGRGSSMADRNSIVAHEGRQDDNRECFLPEGTLYPTSEELSALGLDAGYQPRRRERPGEDAPCIGNTGRTPKQQTDGEVVGDDWPLLTAGEYQVQMLHHETSVIFQTPKVYIHFKILDPGEHHGARVFRAFRVRSLIGRPGKWGRFRLSRGSDLFRTLCRLYPNDPRPDRVSLRALKNTVLRVNVRTVNTDRRQRELPPVCRYSVIDEILSVEAGSI